MTVFYIRIESWFQFGVLFNVVLCQGFGTLLMNEAARIAKEEHGSWKIAVISGNILFFEFV